MRPMSASSRGGQISPDRKAPELRRSSPAGRLQRHERTRRTSRRPRHPYGDHTIVPLSARRTTGFARKHSLDLVEMACVATAHHRSAQFRRQSGSGPDRGASTLPGGLLVHRQSQRRACAACRNRFMSPETTKPLARI